MALESPSQPLRKSKPQPSATIRYRVSGSTLPPKYNTSIQGKTVHSQLYFSAIQLYTTHTSTKINTRLLYPVFPLPTTSMCPRGDLKLHAMFVVDTKAEPSRKPPDEHDAVNTPNRLLTDSAPLALPPIYRRSSLTSASSSASLSLSAVPSTLSRTSSSSPSP